MSSAAESSNLSRRRELNHEKEILRSRKYKAKTRQRTINVHYTQEKKRKEIIEIERNRAISSEIKIAMNIFG
jgi:hypothetical protein